MKNMPTGNEKIVSHYQQRAIPQGVIQLYLLQVLLNIRGSCFASTVRHFARFRIVRRVSVRRHSAHPNVLVRAVRFDKSRSATARCDRRTCTCSAKTIEYTVVDAGTKRGKPKLVSSDGYSFTFKTKKQAVWRCSVRRKAFMCTASVTQEGDIFQAKGTHTHAADPLMLNNILV
ncbi:hypothetical protein DPMN_065481, partial [Dreissena polymorpha]